MEYLAVQTLEATAHNGIYLTLTYIFSFCCVCTTLCIYMSIVYWNWKYLVIFTFSFLFEMCFMLGILTCGTIFSAVGERSRYFLRHYQFSCDHKLKRKYLKSLFRSPQPIMYRVSSLIKILTLILPFLRFIIYFCMSVFYCLGYEKGNANPYLTLKLIMGNYGQFE